VSRLDSKTWSDAVYPDRPGHVFGSPASKAGAERIRSKAESLEDVVRSLLTVHGNLTDFELQEHARKEGILSLLRPRRATLTARGDVVDSGIKRPSPSGVMVTAWRLA
jgi:hypothetical protein